VRIDGHRREARPSGRGRGSDCPGGAEPEGPGAGRNACGALCRPEMEAVPHSRSGTGSRDCRHGLSAEAAVVRPNTALTVRWRRQRHSEQRWHYRTPAGNLQPSHPDASGPCSKISATNRYVVGWLREHQLRQHGWLRERQLRQHARRPAGWRRAIVRFPNGGRSSGSARSRRRPAIVSRRPSAGLAPDANRPPSHIPIHHGPSRSRRCHVGLAAYIGVPAFPPW
jgi:hypothetical protein